MPGYRECGCYDYGDIEFLHTTQCILGRLPGEVQVEKTTIAQESRVLTSDKPSGIITS